MSVAIAHDRFDGGRRFVCRSVIDCPAESLADWHFRPGALDRLMPPWQDVRVEQDAGAMRAGAETVLSVPLGPIRKRWHARIEEAVPGQRFVDIQVSGPFGAWRHEHRFVPSEDDASRSTLEDEIHYRMPWSPLGDLGAGIARRDLDRLFRWRHWRTAGDLRRHRDDGPGRPMIVVVTGASGLVGRALVAFLRTGGHEVRTLVRRDPDRTNGEYRWNPDAGSIDASVLDGADAVVHLAGAGIADERWTEERMRVIRESRVKGTNLLASAIADHGEHPAVFVSASAIGIYGDRSDPVDESSPPGDGWLAEVAEAWEKAADPARAANIRVVHPRIGIVLTPKGGALGKMLLPFRLGAGGPIGSGRQGMSWISLDDLLGVLLRSIADDRLVGPINATTPNPVPQRTFARILGRVLKRPAIAPLPAVVARSVFGRLADPLLLEGAFVTPSRLEAIDFRFETPELESCLRTMLEGTPPV
jgi:uncharacterized protein (TIGR01777 family)